MPEIVVDTNSVVITEPAQIAFREAQSHIANCWRNLDDGPGSKSREMLYEMERSLYANIARMVMISQVHDGELQIQSDGVPENMSFFWIHKQSGYHGGLIFHRIHIEGEPTEFGTWTIHT